MKGWLGNVLPMASKRMKYLIFYNGLTENTRVYLDSIAGNVFRERTVDEATELLQTISKNYDNWNSDETEKKEVYSN